MIVLHIDRLTRETPKWMYNMLRALNRRLDALARKSRPITTRVQLIKQVHAVLPAKMVAWRSRSRHYPFNAAQPTKMVGVTGDLPVLADGAAYLEQLEVAGLVEFIESESTPASRGATISENCLDATIKTGIAISERVAQLSAETSRTTAASGAFGHKLGGRFCTQCDRDTPHKALTCLVCGHADTSRISTRPKLTFSKRKKFARLYARRDNDRNRAFREAAEESRKKFEGTKS